MTSPAYTIYPATLHPLSPTLNAWTRLTVSDLLRLQPAPAGFQGQNLYFHLNHPIRYVRLVGVVVAFSVFEQRTVLILDDSSGATVEVVCRLPKPKPKASTAKAERAPKSNTAKAERPPPELQHKRKLNPTATTATTDRAPTAAAAAAEKGEDEGEGERGGETPPDLTGIDVGTVVKVKGEITEWVGGRQVVLKRIQVVRSTEEEVRCWGETSDFRAGVLSRAWVVGEEERRVFEEGVERKRRRAKRRVDRQRERGKERGKDRKEREKERGKEKEKEKDTKQRRRKRPP